MNTSSTQAATITLRCPEWCTDEPGHVLTDATTRLVLADSDDDSAYVLHHEHRGPKFGDDQFAVGIIATSDAAQWFYDVDMPSAIEDEAGIIEKAQARKLLANISDALAWIETHEMGI